jgi:hypothetical protein
MAARVTPAVLREQNAAGLARIKSAAVDDDWGPYLDGLRQRGASYADTGVAVRSPSRRAPSARCPRRC